LLAETPTEKGHQKGGMGWEDEGSPLLFFSASLSSLLLELWDDQRDINDPIDVQPV
jgi:hypothetical protein